MDTKVPENRSEAEAMLMGALNRIETHDSILFSDHGNENLFNRIEALENKPESNISWLIMSISASLNLMAIVLHHITDGSIAAVATFLVTIILIGVIMYFREHRRD